jgi:hypothetical protein
MPNQSTFFKRSLPKDILRGPPAKTCRYFLENDKVQVQVLITLDQKATRTYNFAFG